MGAIQVISDFPDNLRYLCSYYRSISEVCRRLSINRSQFNRYLNGTAQPTANILRRIADFFGMEDFELHLPQDQFRKIIRAQPMRPAADVPPLYELLKTLISLSDPKLKSYEGWYHEHYFSMAFPGLILRTLTHLYEDAGVMTYVRMERFRAMPQAPLFRCRYRGFAMMLQDRIFLNDFESLTRNELSQTVFYPSFMNRISQLHGIKIGVSSSEQRRPTCVRVVWQFLGRQIDAKAALRRCGAFAPEDFPGSQDILAAIRNSLHGGEFGLLARPPW